MKQAFYVFAVTMMMLLSSGCSSSSDGDSSGGDISGDDNGGGDTTPISAVLGSATVQNGLNAAQALFNVQDYVVAAPARSSAMQAVLSPLRAPIPPDTVEGCYYGGTVAVSGDINETAYDVSLTFTNCEMEPGTIYKSGTIREVALFPDGYTLTYLKDIYMTDVFIQIDGVNSKVFAGSQVELRDILFDTATVELTMQTETAGEIERLEDLVMKLALSSSGDSLCYAAGNVYVDNNLSYYLKISTEYDPLCIDAFTLDTLGTTLVSGSMELVGSDGNVSMHVTSENNITIEGIDGTAIFTVN